MKYRKRFQHNWEKLSNFPLAFPSTTPQPNVAELSELQNQIELQSNKKKRVEFNFDSMSKLDSREKPNCPFLAHDVFPHSKIHFENNTIKFHRFFMNFLNISFDFSNFSFAFFLFFDFFAVQKLNLIQFLCARIS